MRVSTSFRRRFRSAVFVVCSMIDEVYDERKETTNTRRKRQTTNQKKTIIIRVKWKIDLCIMLINIQLTNLIVMEIENIRRKKRSCYLILIYDRYALVNQIIWSSVKEKIEYRHLLSSSFYVRLLESII
jgi:hypothetical protein